MDIDEFRERGKEMIDYICEFVSTIKDKRVTPDLQPGFLKPLLPSEAPVDPESWDEIVKDVENKIVPGLVHWQHPRFFAYFPAGNSFPSLLGDILCDAMGCIGFSWASSPSCTELETIVLDWFGKAIGLPKELLYFTENSQGGGSLQGSASDCIFVAMVAARDHTIARLKEKPEYAHLDETALLGKLVAYCSTQSHSCVEKGARVSFFTLRILEPDEHSSLRGATLEQAIEADVAAGLIPFFVSTTLGTTGGCAFDNLEEIGPVCRKYEEIWLHVDGAYAGNSFICPEFRYLMAGIEYADSFNTNPNKFLLTNFDCSCLWVRDRMKVIKALVVDPIYLEHPNEESAIDYRNWSLPLSRRFRSLKLWFVLRNYGISGLQAYIRNHVKVAKHFEALVKTDPRFEVVNDVLLGLVCFRAKGTDDFNKEFLMNINDSGKLHMIPSVINGQYIIRFAIGAPNATLEDVEIAWSIIKEILADTMARKPHKKHTFISRIVADPASQTGFAKIPLLNKPETQPTIASRTSRSLKSQPALRSWVSRPLAYLKHTRDAADTGES
ncbi:aromatic-L-amino-acid decarboxylase-like [Copidosoma floridanum]|uniref:aromatic-L-amino-acid decarboxylase-like n=1 Tax=Copidosoma floridanum TaxID=29053 RepID=UPI0006C9D487|nr:aromatic-L-amino-acid decarboxylase-like [Copidosoma floridanum]